jgi:hypothetical protein
MMREPVSWLELERHALGELDGERAAAIEASADPDTRACLERARQPRSLRPLPARPAPAPSWLERLRRRWALGAGVLAAACAALLVVVLRGGDQRRGGTVKGGGEPEIELIRERNGDVTPAATSFRDGDRFKVVVTCAPDRRLLGEVVVRQAGQSYRPLPAVDVACGNRVPLPGAFRLTGTDPAEICLHPDGAAPVCAGLVPR